MTTKIEKIGQVQEEAKSELNKSQKKVKILEKQLQMLIRKNRQLEKKIGVSKKENDRLLDVVKTHRHEADLSQKEAHRLVFENSRFKSFVSDKEKKLTKYLEACEVKFAKMKVHF